MTRQPSGQTYYDPEGQRERREKICDTLVAYTGNKIDAAGTWTGDVPPDLLESQRMHVWFAQSYFASTDPEADDVANTLVTTADFEFGHFIPMAALRLLYRFGDQLDADAEERLRTYVEDHIDHVTHESVGFVGTNTNFPVMSTYAAILGGQLLDDDEAFRAGVDRLDELVDVLRRRGTTTEFNSPTYTPVQILGIAELANHVEDEAVAETALKCEERLWVDLLGHYHPQTGHLAGPSARSYTVDSVAHTHQDRCIVYGLAGDRMPVTPLDDLFSSPEADDVQVIHHDPPFMQVSAAWLTTPDYHCPAWLVERMLDKPEAYTMRGDYEYTASGDPVPGWQTDAPLSEDLLYEYPAGSGSMYTYMTDDYALGTATDEFLDGAQTDSFHLLYRRRRPATGPGHVGAMYSRYVTDEKKPGQLNEYPRLDAEWGEDLLRDEGRKRAFQSDNTAMALYNPRAYGNENVSSLKLSVLMPAHYESVDEVWIGDRKLTDGTGASEDVTPVFVRDGPVYAAIRPLALTDHGRSEAITVERENDYTVLSLYNYDDEERDFARKEFVCTCNGFVFEVRDEDEVDSFAAFREQIGAASVSDDVAVRSGAVGSNIVRSVSYERDDLQLACAYSPVGQGVKYASVDGETVDRPKLDVTGLEEESLPFH